MQEEKTIYQESTIPYYAVGCFWLIYACLLNMYRFTDFLIVGVISLVIFMVLKKVIKPKEIKVMVDILTKDTGNQVADSMIDMLEKQIKLLLNHNFSSASLIKNSEEIISCCQQLIKSIKKDVNKAISVERSISYIDTLLVKFVEQYDYFSQLNSENQTVKSGLLQIENAFSKIKEVYLKQIDELNKDHVLDLSLDIKVMEGIFQQDELTIESFIKKSKGEQ